MKKPVSNLGEAGGVPAKDVDAWLALVPTDTRRVLEDLRAAIRAAAPEAEEAISYRIPTYKYYGPLVHFVARENGCSFIVASRSVVESLRSELAGFNVSGTTIHFSAERPIPAPLVERIVRARLEENRARSQSKSGPATKSGQ